MMRGGISRRSNKDLSNMKTILIVAAAVFAATVVASAPASAAGPSQSHCDMAGHNTGMPGVSEEKLDRRQFTASPKVLANFPNLAAQTAQTAKEGSPGMACCQGKKAVDTAKHCDMPKMAESAPAGAKP